MRNGDVRPIILGNSKVITAYDIQTPAPITGTGSTSGGSFSNWVTFSGNAFVALAGYYGVEGCTGGLSNGGNLTASVEFASGVSTVATLPLWNMNTTQLPVEIQTHGIGTVEATGENAGTFYSTSYTEIGPIPAGSGYLTGAGGFGCHLSPLSGHDIELCIGIGRVTLELCDEDENILVEVLGLELDTNNPPLAEGTTDCNPLCATNIFISWGGIITKARLKYEISNATNAGGTATYTGSLVRVF